MRHKHSDYMHWSKTQSPARFNLATSGVAAFLLCDLPLDLKKLEINGDNSYGYAPLQEAIARHHGVDPECVVESAGTSMANHLAMAAIIEPGDEVLIEHPAYGPILDVAYYLEAKVKRFPRTEENGWAVDPEEIRRCVTTNTRLIVITNLHNPTSVLTPDSVLLEVGEIARTVGALVLVDEVYLDAVYEGTPRTSFHIGPEFVVTSSFCVSSKFFCVVCNSSFVFFKSVRVTFNCPSVLILAAFSSSVTGAARMESSTTLAPAARFGETWDGGVRPAFRCPSSVRCLRPSRAFCSAEAITSGFSFFPPAVRAFVDFGAVALARPASVLSLFFFIVRRCRGLGSLDREN